ncbi:hypothetical protein [Saccharopolyspora sp. CA-218241]|uniref:hypothetical protein n=1 Tax=Saccharopolyspora sp. CA-218241 TaxID=3240027 RepID=UPI003D96374F
MREVVRAVQMEGLMGRPPLETVLRERSGTFSDEERERNAIARTDPEVLDEPTSALDGRTEAVFTAALRRIAAERAVLVIAHRFSTIQAADRVVVARRRAHRGVRGPRRGAADQRVLPPDGRGQRGMTAQRAGASWPPRATEASASATSRA